MTPERQAPLFLFGTSGTLLLGALAFQFIGGLNPCEMCFWQRYAHLAVLLIAGIGLVINLSWIRWLAVFAMAVAAALAAWHAGIELKWWPGVTACTASTAGATMADMMSQLSTPLVRCDQAPWSLLGISMAGWNAIISAGAALIGGFLIRFNRKPRPYRESIRA